MMAGLWWGDGVKVTNFSSTSKPAGWIVKIELTGTDPMVLGHLLAELAEQQHPKTPAPRAKKPTKPLLLTDRRGLDPEIEV